MSRYNHRAFDRFGISTIQLDTRELGNEVSM